MIITTRFNDMSVTDVTEKWRVKVKFNDFVVTDVTENWHVKVLMLKGEKGDTGDAGDYSTLRNKPQINGVTLVGNKTASDLNLATEADLEDVQSDIADLQTAVGNNTSDITDLQTDVGNNTGDISDLQTAVGNNTRNISDLQTAVSTKADASDLEDLEAEVALKADASDLDLYVPKSGGTMTGPLVLNDKNNQFAYMPYSWVTSGSSTIGWLRIATINIADTQFDAPIEFLVQRRHDARSVKLSVLFNSQNTADPTLSGIYYDDISGTRSTNPFQAFIYKASTSTWDVYVYMSGAYDSISVYTLMPYYAQRWGSVSYAYGFLSSVPSGATMAYSASKYFDITKASGISSLEGWGAQTGNLASFFVVMTNGTTQKSGGTDVLATGLPVPRFGSIQSIASVYTNGGSWSSMVRVRLNINGELQLWYGGNLPAQYILAMQMTYIT